MLLKISFFIENGCILCLTKDEDKFRRWQICSLEVVRAVSQFEDSTVLKENEHSKFQEKVLSRNICEACVFTYNRI